MSMTRRSFCKISALSAIAAFLMPGRAFASVAKDTKQLKGTCNVEVVRCQCFPELQSRYLEDPECGKCPRFQVGQTITITPQNFAGYKRSKEMCPHAWRILEPYILAALSAGETNECAPAANPHRAVVSCPDGTRPVIFKVSSI